MITKLKTWWLDTAKENMSDLEDGWKSHNRTWRVRMWKTQKVGDLGGVVRKPDGRVFGVTGGEERG